MLKLEVEIYGLPPEITALHRVHLELEGETNMQSLLGVLISKIPALKGTVINHAGNELVEGYTFNINGQFYSRGQAVVINRGDHIVLLALASGG